MKTKFSAIIASLLLFLAASSCGRQKGMFVLQGTVHDGTDSILVVGLDNRFPYVDTISCRDGLFKWSFRPDTVTTLILILPDGRQYPVFAEKDVRSEILIPEYPGLYTISGGQYNDAYNAFCLASANDSTMEQTAARIDSFITRDPFSEVTPFLIYDNMVRRYHAGEKDITSLVNRMSGNMQDAPYLVSLKSEFEKTMPTNVYLDNYSINDSTGYSYRLREMGGSINHMLVCVWASWMGSKGLEARDTLQYFLDKYRERNLNAIDISIDVEPRRWKESILPDTVSWSSYNDPKGWESRIITSTKLQTLPAFILLTGTKRMVFKTSDLDEMDRELDNVLQKPKNTANKTR